jgi:hypothetical protein
MRLGKGRHAIYLAVFLFISASAGGQAVINYKYQFDGNLQIINVNTEGQSLIVNYTLPEVNIENITNSSGIFYRIRIPGHTPTVSTGKPELPVYSRLISVPEGSGFKIKVSEVKSTRLKPSGKKIAGILFPAQEGETKQQQRTKTEFQFDKYEYSKRGIIASDTVRIEKLGKIRGNTLANLIITPVRYNPRLNNIEVITSMRIEIVFSSPLKSAVKSQNYQSSHLNETLLKGVLNYNPGEVVPGYTDQPVKMVIITDTAFRKQLQPYLKWKLQKGFKVSVLYKGTGNVGSSYLELKDTLTKIYNASSTESPAPQYLLIIGDVTRIPYYGSGGSGNVTDMYYGEFDGNGDYIPEMLVGRIPVADTTELKNVVQKLIQYEKFQFAGTNKFYSSAVGAAGSDDAYSTQMNGQLKYLTGNYLVPQNNVTEHHFFYPSSLTMEKDSIIKLINTGTSLINYTGHGDASGWLHVNIKVADTAKFLNNNMYPVIISNACQTARLREKRGNRFYRMFK